MKYITLLFLFTLTLSIKITHTTDEMIVGGWENHSLDEANKEINDFIKQQIP